MAVESRPSRRRRPFRDGGRPVRESPRRRLLIRGVAVAALAVTGAYLAWRIAAGTVNLAVWWVAVPLLVVEIHNAFGLALYTVALWDVDGGPQASPAKPHPGGRGRAPDRGPDSHL